MSAGEPFLPGADGPAGPGAVLEALLASVADAIYVVDHEGRVRFANPAALEVLGVAEADLLGRPSHATIHHHRPDGTPFPEEQCPLLRPRTSGETVRVTDDWFVRGDGSFVPVSYSSAPLATAGGRGAVVVFRDETERRRAEEARRREDVERARADAVAASRARIVEAADAERRRIGRDLHDGAQQRLMSVALTVQHGLADLGRDPEAARATLELAVAEARGAIGELRELVAGIHPTILTSRGLTAAVESLTARSPVLVTTSVPERRRPARVEATAYFVVAEALANVARHAGATRARVEVTEDDDALRVVVADDGRGGADPRAGSGLQGLRDRVEAVGGTFAVADGPAGGTVVTAGLPLGEPGTAGPGEPGAAGPGGRATAG
ncbi:histidine kinase [Patulibacter sp.]|uniref:sensor histidine kinase n=1 Tax=Patulibacter sp. TaxID=1912859 RepID=UPI002718837B|nr:histidine kinase [Patulibacter sp.]MDO9409424.1 histidine kinase [Patulibacter sp.]